MTYPKHLILLSLDHQILLSKMYNYGFRGSIWSWLHSYLSGRKSITTINSTQSSVCSIHYSVPQGSVLGPLLFLLYINDLGFSPDLPSKPKIYADDTNVFVHGKSIAELQIKSQFTLDRVSQWVSANRLTINIEKTHFMIFSPSFSSDDLSQFSLFLNSKAINRVSSIKFLGLIIDDELSWTLHIQSLCQYLKKHIGIFYKLRSFIPIKILRMLYFSLIHSKILYGIENYANNYAIRLHDLTILNNRVLRIIQNKNSRSSILDLYRDFNTLPINKLFQFKILAHAHALYNKSPSLPSFFYAEVMANHQVHTYSTRSQDDFHRLSISTRNGEHLSINVCSKLWNSLPASTKSLSSLTQFEKAIKIMLWEDLII